LLPGSSLVGRLPITTTAAATAERGNGFGMLFYYYYYYVCLFYVALLCSLFFNVVYSIYVYFYLF